MKKMFSNYLLALSLFWVFGFWLSFRKGRKMYLITRLATASRNPALVQWESSSR